MKKQFQWPSYSAKEVNIVSNVISSGKVNYLFGDLGKNFEHQFSLFSDSKYALAVANGTLALDLCLRAIGINSNDEVLVTSRSFVASASCISLLGAKPIFCDVDINSQNISLEEIKSKITKKTRALICVHFAGFPCNMPEIMKLAKQKNIKVIEDCAQAHGASINNKSVGSFGDLSAWSFCNDKIMTLLGEGGMVTTNSKKYFDFISSFNNHGKNLSKYFKPKDHKSFPFFHDSIGSNYRLTELQSAVGIYQLSKMNQWNKLRTRNASIIIESVRNIKLVSYPLLPTGYHHAWYKLYLTINNQMLKKFSKRQNILDDLRSNNVPAYFGGCGEIYREKAFAKLQPKNRLLNASYLENNSIMLEVHPTITIKEIKRRAGVLKDILLKHQS
jgi:dTDP-4-amino-4,6-dideoxygalactose transaminase